MKVIIISFLYCTLCRPRWIKVSGITYQPGCFVVRGFEGTMPLFGKIESIVLVAGEPIPILQCLTTAGFCEHIRCYVLDCAHANSYLQAFVFSELADYYPLHSHTSFSQSDHHLYICLKWNIENVNDKSLIE